jgi:hypothetical protein
MNASAAAATGDALLFLHSDTRLPAGAEQLFSMHCRKIPGADSTRPSRALGAAPGDRLF